MQPSRMQEVQKLFGEKNLNTKEDGNPRFELITFF